MDARTRYRNALRFGPVDRLPAMEWASWWNLTIDRWHGEGLPCDLTTPPEISEFFGLDVHRQFWLAPGSVPVQDASEYTAAKGEIYRADLIDEDAVGFAAQCQERGDCAVWLSLDGFFWFPRKLLGIQRHLYAFYDEPDLMHALNRDLLEYGLSLLDQFCDICTPDFMTFGEDMSYNHGPMISKAQFDDFIAPYYAQIVPELVARDIVPIIDSDGDIAELVPWFAEVGVDGFLPLEKRAGTDIAAIRERSPRCRIIGAFDKNVMTQGEDAMRAEFERLLPIMRQGGYIPGVDHQTTPHVSIDQYRLYVSLLHEYCVLGAHPF